MWSVNNEQEANFIERMIEEAKAGRVTLPKRAPGQTKISEFFGKEPGISSEEFWEFYNNR